MFKRIWLLVILFPVLGSTGIFQESTGILENRGFLSNHFNQLLNKNKVKPVCNVLKSVRGRGGNAETKIQCIFISISPSHQNLVTDSFIAAGIVPDVIDVAPNRYLNVVFPTGVEAQLGNVLTPTLVQYKPTVTWNAQPKTLYTLLMVDPDVPSRTDKSMGAIVHWMVVNIKNDYVSKGQTVYEYFGSAPDPRTGLHRYTLLVLKQRSWIVTNEYFSNDSSTDQRGRAMTKTKEFIQNRNLGIPVFGNFYYAEYDPIAKIIREGLGIPIME